MATACRCKLLWDLKITIAYIPLLSWELALALSGFIIIAMLCLAFIAAKYTPRSNAQDHIGRL